MAIIPLISGFFSTMNEVIFNFLMNALPDDLFSNSYIRPALARTFGIRCGKDCQIRKRTYFEFPHNLVMGNNVFLNRHSYIDACGGIIIGNNVRLGPEVMMITGSHEMGLPEMRTGKVITKPIIIEDGCWIGARVTITSGVTIGKGSVVSAGSVVQRAMPRNFLIAGNPARPISDLARLNDSKSP